MQSKKQRGSFFSRGDSAFMFVIFISVLFIAIWGSYRNTPTINPASSPEPCPSPTIAVTDLPFYDLVYAASVEYDIEVERIYAVIKAESSFDPDAVSRVGAMGLMQMMPSTYRDVCESLGMEYERHDLFDPATNINACTYYLKKQYDKFGDWDQAHAAYNAGANNVRKWLQDPEYSENGKLIKIPFKETSNYVKKVNTFYLEYKALLNP